MKKAFASFMIWKTVRFGGCSVRDAYAHPEFEERWHRYEQPIDRILVFTG